jgi:hypothetical protein
LKPVLARHNSTPLYTVSVSQADEKLMVTARGEGGKEFKLSVSAAKHDPETLPTKLVFRDGKLCLRRRRKKVISQ